MRSHGEASVSEGLVHSALPASPGEPLAELGFGLADLAAVRRMVGSIALDAGASLRRAEELVLAVNEIATNALVHGEPPATVRIWRGEEDLVFEVSDAGRGIKDVLAGQLTPAAAGLGGRGLWLARQLCDAVEIRNGTGCTVSLHARTPLSRAG